MTGLSELLVQITTLPVIGIALAFLVFMATNKAWVFFLMPLFYWGLSSLAPLIPATAPEDSPALFSAVGAWLYLPQLLATAIAYGIYVRKKRVWVFLAAPVLGWILQFASLVFIVLYLNQTAYL